MKRSQHKYVVLMAVGILLGACPILSADDGKASKSQEEIKSLVNQLGSKRFQEREEAARELSQLGKAALASLQEAAQRPDAEVRRRAQQLVERMEPPAIAPSIPKCPHTVNLKSYL
jgi:hypothetical protein